MAIYGSRFFLGVCYDLRLRGGRLFVIFSRGGVGQRTNLTRELVVDTDAKGSLGKRRHMDVQLDVAVSAVPD